VSHEITEKIEHAAHEAGSLTRYIGLTIAVVGVLMAVCAAEVGQARTDLIATMVNENGAKGEYQTISTKYRTLQAVLQHLHAAMPDLELMDKTDKELAPITSAVKNSNSESAQGIRVMRLETKKVLSAVIPTGEDVKRLIDLVEAYEKQADVAKEWSESYHDAIEVHKDSATKFEIAQVAAEIAVVIASVGLLLGSRKWFARGAWVTAMLLGVISMSLFGWTFVVNHQRLHGAEHMIEESRKHYEGKIDEKKDREDDRKLIEETKKAVEKLEHLLNQP
jgi:Domain of unknown function (DUF4337)